MDDANFSTSIKILCDDVAGYAARARRENQSNSEGTWYRLRNGYPLLAMQ